AAPVRPSLQTDPVGHDIAARAQVGQGAVGIERSHRRLTDLRRPLIVAEAWEALRVATGAEAVDEKGEIAALAPQLSPQLVAPRERRGIVDAAGARGVRASPAVHHHHSGYARRLHRGRPEQVADQLGLAVVAEEGDALRQGLGLRQPGLDEDRQGCHRHATELHARPSHLARPHPAISTPNARRGLPHFTYVATRAAATISAQATARVQAGSAKPRATSRAVERMRAA